MITNIKYELYQAKANGDNANFIFSSYDFIVRKKMDNLIVADNYNKVIVGDIETADSDVDVLNYLFHEFNSDSPRNFRSMSVSDVVVITYTENNNIYTKAYYCNSLGWVELDVKKFLNQKKMTLEEYIVIYLNSYGKGNPELDCNHCPLCDECTQHYIDTHGGCLPTSLEDISCKSFFFEYFNLTT